MSVADALYYLDEIVETLQQYNAYEKQIKLGVGVCRRRINEKEFRKSVIELWGMLQHSGTIYQTQMVAHVASCLAAMADLYADRAGVQRRAEVAQSATEASRIGRRQAGVASRSNRLAP